jgi:tetratricopeptide (TPR) repeat protein
MRRLKLLTVLPLLVLLAACSRDPKAQAQRYVENGNKFFAREKFKEASIMYRRALQKDLLFGEAYYRLGLTNLKLSNFSEAYGTLVRATELQPENTDASIKLAELVLMVASSNQQNASRYLEEATQLAEKLVAKDPSSYDGNRLMGQILFLKKDFAGAVKNLQLAYQSKPDQPDTVFGYFQALANNDQFDEAEKLAKDFLSKKKDYAPLYDILYLQYGTRRRLPEAEQVLRLKVDNNPNNGNFILQLATHYYITQQRAAMDSAIARLQDDKNFPNGRLLAGDFFFLRLREFENARQQYEAGVSAFPAEKLLYQKRLVELFAATNRSADANNLLSAILKDHAEDPEAIAMRAALRLTTGSREEINLAANDLQSLVTKTPNNHLLRFNLARALVAKGNVDQARLELEQAIKLRSDFVVARELLTRIYLVKQDAGRALKEADDIIRLDAKNLSAHLSRSSALLLQNDRDKAREELDYITRTYPNNVEARFQVGFLAWQEKDFSRASQIFSELHKTNPSDMRGLVGVVETLAGQNRMPEAIREMETAAKAEPDRRDLQVALGNMYVRSEQYDRAIQIYEALLAKDPKAADVLFRVAETYRRKGDLNVAIDRFRSASQAAPNDTNSLLQLGLLMDGTGRRDQARPIYEQILKIQPDHPIALNNLAFIKAEDGVDLDSALRMAQQARQRLPNSPDIADTLGWIYIKKNLTDDAVKLFTDLVRQSPANPSFRFHYGMALYQKGDRPSAKRELETALRNNPSKDEIGKIQDLLRQL